MVLLQFFIVLYSSHALKGRIISKSEINSHCICCCPWLFLCVKYFYLFVFSPNCNINWLFSSKFVESSLNLYRYHMFHFLYKLQIYFCWTFSKIVNKYLLKWSNEHEYLLVTFQTDIASCLHLWSRKYYSEVKP